MQFHPFATRAAALAAPASAAATAAGYLDSLGRSVRTANAQARQHADMTFAHIVGMLELARSLPPVATPSSETIAELRPALEAVENAANLRTPTVPVRLTEIRPLLAALAETADGAWPEDETVTAATRRLHDVLDAVYA